MSPRLLELGDGALTLEFGDSIDPAVNARVMAARDALQTRALDGISDVVPTWRSLTVHFDPLRLPHARLRQALVEAAESTSATLTVSGRDWTIPVCFGGEFGPDLAQVAQTVGRSEGEVIAALCGIELRVFLIGFLPGFPYLGILPDWLRLPRRTTPRTAVPANSLAIAGEQAAIYPWTSPGGWHLLGRTPTLLFDAANAEQPSLLAPGDRVRLHPITAAEFAAPHA